MSQLKQTQQAFMDYIADKHPSPDFIDDSKLLDIYKGSITGNFLEAFKDVYHVVRELVGPEFFEFAFANYHKQTPNTYYDISSYGETFADFLASFEPCKSLPYLPDVARLEWFCHKACLAQADKACHFSELAKMTEAQLNQVCFKLSASASLLSSAFPILDIYHVNQPGFTGSQRVDLSKGNVKLLILQQGLDLKIAQLTDEEYLSLTLFQQGQPVGKMLYSLNVEHQLSEQACEDLLAKLIQRGWLVGFNVLE